MRSRFVHFPIEKWQIRFEMTFRELRQFAEITLSLGYPGNVGIDSFDTPNFGLMASLLQWYANLFDPEIVVYPELSSEGGRVDFVKTVVQQLATRSGIRLNPRKLYASDRYAVRELLKLAVPIYRGISSPPAKQESLSRSVPSSAQKINEYSASVPRRAVELYDGLANELLIRDNRSKVISTVPPLSEVEDEVGRSIEASGTRLDTLTKELDRLNSDEEALRAKIKDRRVELDRATKRLLSVKTIRPAYMDEYEALEQELEELFRIYFCHYRNVDYFENQLQKQEEKHAANLAKITKKISAINKKAAKQVFRGIMDSFDPNLPDPGETAFGEDDSNF